MYAQPRVVYAQPQQVHGFGVQQPHQAFGAYRPQPYGAPALRPQPYGAPAHPQKPALPQATAGGKLGGIVSQIK